MVPGPDETRSPSRTLLSHSDDSCSSSFYPLRFAAVCRGRHDVQPEGWRPVQDADAHSGTLLGLAGRPVVTKLDLIELSDRVRVLADASPKWLHARGLLSALSLILRASITCQKAVRAANSRPGPTFCTKNSASARRTAHGPVVSAWCASNSS